MNSIYSVMIVSTIVICTVKGNSVASIDSPTPSPTFLETSCPCHDMFLSTNIFQHSDRGVPFEQPRVTVFEQQGYFVAKCSHLLKFRGYCGCPSYFEYMNTGIENKCTFCPNGEAPSLLDKNIPFIVTGRVWKLRILTCGNLYDVFSTLNE